MLFQNTKPSSQNFKHDKNFDGNEIKARQKASWANSLWMNVILEMEITWMPILY